MNSRAVMNPLHDKIPNGWGTIKRHVPAVSNTPVPVVHYVGKSKYLPHIGTKEVARHAGKTTLGPNASRALRA